LVFSWKLIFAARFQSEKISLEELLHYMRSLNNKKHSFKWENNLEKQLEIANTEKKLLEMKR
jgi:hypothetical protein